MSEQYITDFLLILFEKIQIFIFRPAVLTQLSAIAAILVGVSMVSTPTTFFLKRLVPPPAADAKKTFLQYVMPSIRLLILPILALVVTNFAISNLASQGFRVGLINLLLSIFWTYLSYRIFLAILYTVFTEKDVYRYHWRLFSPLFGLFVFYQVANLFIDINNTANVVLANLFGKPLVIGSLFVAVVGLYFWIDLIFGAKDIFFRFATKYTSVNAGRLDAGLTLGSYILLAGGFAMSISYLGINPTVFAAITGGLSVGIGFGMQQIFGNFISGILILFQGFIRPGDIIQVGTVRAIIKRMGSSATFVRTYDGDEIIIPNQKLLTLEVKTFTGSDSLYRYKPIIRVSYEHDPDMVLKVLKDVIATIPVILTNPAPKVNLVNLAESWMEFRLQIWADLLKAGTTPGGINHAVNMAVLREFAKHGIKIPVPQRELHIINEDSNSSLEPTITEKPQL